MKQNPIGFLFMLALVIGIPLGFVVAVNWWLETRFGANVAILTWGGALAIVCLLIGAIVVIITQRITLMGAADVLHSYTQSSKAQFAVMKEQAKLEKSAFDKRAQMEVINYRQVNKLADQRAKLLMQAAQDAGGADDEDDEFGAIAVDYQEVE